MWLEWECPVSVKKVSGGLPSFQPQIPVVGNLSPNAGDVDLLPDHGTKIPHAVGHLNSRATFKEALLLQLGKHVCSRDLRLQKKRSPHTVIRSLCAATKTQRSQNKGGGEEGL